MFKKNLFLGLGIGIIISSTILYINFVSYKRNMKDTIDNSEIISKAYELGMILKSEVPSIEIKTLSNEEIISKAEELGMVFKIEETTEISTIETIEIEIESETLSTIINEEISIRITPGTSATEVSQILYEVGLIDDANNFHTFIKDNKKLNAIQVGFFRIPTNSSYEEILKILTTTPK